jgi:putative ABC transport system ATP-binding protein
MTVLSARNLVLQRGKETRLSLPDIAVQAGEKVLLLGASGSGKTSLLAALSGLLVPVSGDVHMAGKNLYQLSAHQRDQWRARHIACIFQTLHLVSSLDVMANLLLAMRMAGQKADKMLVADRLEQLGLSGLQTRLPHQLSVGEQQRVAIARATLGQSRIIMADEPTSALDDANAEHVMQLLLQASSSGAALLVATHDKRIAAHFDRVIDLSPAMKAAA